MKHIVTFLAAAVIAGPAIGQTHHLVVADFGGGDASSPGGPGGGSTWGSGSMGAGGSSSSLDLDGDGQAETVEFADADGALLGLSINGAFTPLDHDPIAALSAFDLDGDTWLNAVEMDAAGLALHGASGEIAASSQMTDLYLEVVEYANELCLGGYRSNGDVYATTLATGIEVAGVVTLPSVSTIAVVTAPADPNHGNCARSPSDLAGMKCTTDGAACTRDTHAGTCQTKVLRQGLQPAKSYCICDTGKKLSGLVDTRLGLLLSALLVMGATALTLRTSTAARA